MYSVCPSKMKQILCCIYAVVSFRQSQTGHLEETHYTNSQQTYGIRQKFTYFYQTTDSIFKSDVFSEFILQCELPSLSLG
jgi:hypothetical protein